jgi:hypothetical protein
MMHRLARGLALLGACLAGVALGAPGADAARDRSWQVVLSPAPGDVSLVQIGFLDPAGARVSAATLEVSAPGVFGSDYMAVAAPRPTLGRAGVLVLVANRPSPLLDPAHVALTVRARRALGPATVLSVRAVLSSHGSVARPRLCNLALDGAPLSPQGLTVLGGAGERLAGLGGAEALAQAYDIACGLPNPGTLRGALSLPVGGGCTPCYPRPGFACPLVKATGAICAEPLRLRLRSAAASTD